MLRTKEKLTFDLNRSFNKSTKIEMIITPDDI